MNDASTPLWWMKAVPPKSRNRSPCSAVSARMHVRLHWFDALWKVSARGLASKSRQSSAGSTQQSPTTPAQQTGRVLSQCRWSNYLQPYFSHRTSPSPQGPPMKLADLLSQRRIILIPAALSARRHARFPDPSFDPPLRPAAGTLMVEGPAASRAGTGAGRGVGGGGGGAGQGREGDGGGQHPGPGRCAGAGPGPALRPHQDHRRSVPRGPVRAPSTHAQSTRARARTRPRPRTHTHTRAQAHLPHAHAPSPDTRLMFFCPPPPLPPRGCALCSGPGGGQPGGAASPR